MTTIACLGDIDLDLLVTVDRYPVRGEESFAKDALIGLGGSGLFSDISTSTAGSASVSTNRMNVNIFGASGEG